MYIRMKAVYEAYDYSQMAVVEWWIKFRSGGERTGDLSDTRYAHI